LVFKSPRDLSNLAGQGDDMFGFTTAVKNEIKKIVKPFKNEIMKQLKRQ
jgi:preprotein translocase subunit SecE